MPEVQQKLLSKGNMWEQWQENGNTLCKITFQKSWNENIAKYISLSLNYMY